MLNTFIMLLGSITFSALVIIIPFGWKTVFDMMGGRTR